MHRQHLEAAKRRVGHLPVGVETRLPCGRHDLLVESIGDFLVGGSRKTEKSLEHGLFSFPLLASSRPVCCIGAQAGFTAFGGRRKLGHNGG